MLCNSSHYYNYALQLIAQEKTMLRYYEFCKLECIEMLIWPLLYKKKNGVNLISQDIYVNFSSVAISLPYTHFIYKYRKYNLYFHDHAFFSQDSRLSAKHCSGAKFKTG